MLHTHEPDPERDRHPPRGAGTPDGEAQAPTELVGGLLIAAGLGLRFDFTTTAIACLAGLGGLLVAAALIPKKRRSSKA